MLEFVSTVIKTGNVNGSILCLVGPPGVGKTSIGKSIAESLNRKFYRFSVGGMVDEAEIKGHRRTYIGAMPGKIIQALKLVQTSNPVIMIDEIDKIGNSFRGDPASALLEVLDPEQNKDFLDHYLDIRYDLSKILFVTTANQLDTIPRPLLDRMEIIHLSGYILEEKLQIAQKYLIPQQLKAHALDNKEITISKNALKFIIDKYAREAGVRTLDKCIRKIMRKVNLKIAEGNKEKVRINENNVESYLGVPIFTTEELYQNEIPGVTLGLAWTSMGGATLYIEAASISNKESGLKLTGQLGDVMKESAEIAYSYIRSLLAKDNTLPAEAKEFFDKNRVHLHVPEGATPKDGPSAGITMALALYSLATNTPIRKGIAMTGELTLTGKVLPIGGVREKTIAARRVGIFELLLPKDNKKDFDRLPDFLKTGITVNYVDYFTDVINYTIKK
ncbi:endopeptidase La [Cetobacterium somerae]